MSQKWTAADIPDQTGRVAVVTGANSGIGYEAALELARHGAHVVLACRSPERGDAAVAALLDELPGASVRCARLDLASLASVRAFSEAFLAGHDRLDLLVNNAGLMALPYGRTEDGFETQMGVNHFGHFALTGLLVGALIGTPGSRVVTVSSGMHAAGTIDFDDLDHERHYQKWAAYGQSKLANLLFAFELQRRLSTTGAATLSVACHPGYAATELQAKGPRLAGSRVMESLMQLGNALIGQTAAMGALPTLYAATAEPIQGGEYIGPRFLTLRGHPTLEEPRPKARDTAAAARLWDVSVERSGVDFAALSAHRD